MQALQLTDVGDPTGGAQDSMRFTLRFTSQKGNQIMSVVFRLPELLLEYEGDHSVWD